MSEQNGIVEFNPTEFREIYPEFAYMSDAQLEYFFSLAEINLNNTKCSAVKSLKERKLLLYLLTAHLCALYARDNPQGGEGASSGGLVGRISSATTGTVSVHADMGEVNQNAAWYMQTGYGATYWALTSKYRTFKQVTARSPSLTPSHYFRKFGRNFVPRV